MFTTTDSGQYNRQSIIVYGESGSGKTSLAKTVPGKKIIVNAENGLRSLKGSNIDVYDITVDRDGNIMDRKFRFQKLLAFLELMSTQEYKDKYEWLIFDSLAEITQCYVEYLKDKHPDGKDALKLWGEYNDGTAGFVKALRDFAPYNILIFALESIDKDESGRRYVGIDINGKISSRVPAMFDECFQLKIFTNDQGIQKRFLITSKHENNVAKDRSGNLDKFEEANIKDIVNKMNGKPNTKEKTDV